MNNHTSIPGEELNVLNKLDDVQVIFDVGARADVEYIKMFPHAEFHLFEPLPEFFAELSENVDRLKHDGTVYLNNYGLGDEEGTFGYCRTRQCFEKGESPTTWQGNFIMLPVTTLDWYIDKYKIKRIDFLKIDAEGYDYKILKGGQKAIDIARYIQYEHWDNKEQFHTLLGKDFDMEYIGYRNVLCKRKS